MIIQTVDYNGAGELFSGRLSDCWAEIESSLIDAPLHVKESDQAGKQGSLIFDPVGTNDAIKTRLHGYGWLPNVKMPSNFRFLGTDIDFIKNEVLVEVQFSNYPFFLNNVVRSELLYKSEVRIPDDNISVAVIVVKAHMFPASNSTLYYEQAINQLEELAKNKVFDIPIRVVGLFENIGAVTATFTRYSGRYSRTVVERKDVPVEIQPFGRAGSRCSMTL